MTAGIYSITCLANGKQYVGSTNDIRRRWGEHRCDLARGDHRNRHLQNAWKKYGADQFVFAVLEEADRGVLIARELHWVEAIKPEFNLMVPDLEREGFRFTDETLRKIGATQKPHPNTPETRRKISEARKGTKMADSTRLAIRKANVGRPSEKRGKPLPAEQRRKLSLALKGRPSARKGRKFPKQTKAQLRLELP